MSAFPDDCVLHCPESELAVLIGKSPRLEQHSGIARLSNRYLAKAYDPASAEDTLEAVEVAHRLGIRVPRFVRSVRCGDMVFAMERVEGDTLQDAWPSLGWWRSLRLALQLRRFILKMRSVTSKTAGSLVTGDCRSFWLDDHFGLPARAMPSDISAFFTFWANFISIRQELKKDSHHHSSLTGIPPLSLSRLVFTHHDLAPRNMVVDSSNGLWLLDWDFAGFYPAYFEYASMYNFTLPPDWDILSRIRWNLFTWIAAGRPEKESRLLRIARSKFLRFGAGRRCSIRAQATKSRRHGQIVSDSKASDSSTEED
ncbi:hypothetical protein HIM_06652 [Hirsutella minnesotensis 3608]|uniref:Aminoglycoside phosphotransferase domain-containing protein n=1 Tax=Hirsutella minnesotensis 3608 TaxID=1043627 RepID=A0A0F8A4Q4_9HYPO|nr:hypothetical protein HIM_06652 [Hirsutella minnesotensis 3608]